MSSKSADYYLDGLMYAVRDTPVYSIPNGTKLKTVAKGGYIGKVYSYVVRDGFVWWMLYDNTHVKQDPSGIRIDEATTSGAEIERQKAAQKEAEENDLLNVAETALKKTVKGAGDVVAGAGETLSGIGKNFTTILIVILIIALVVGAVYANKVYGIGAK